MTDIKYLQDEADLSVGLSVTCSTTFDHQFHTNEAQHPYAPSSSFYSIHNYNQDQNSMYNPGPAIHTPDFGLSQSFMTSDHGSSFNQREDYIQDTNAGVYQESKYKPSKHIPPAEKTRPNVFTSSRKSLPEAHKMQVCKTCGKTFKFQTSLLRHNNKVHICRYQCKTCCRVFSRQSYLDVHTSKPGTTCFIEQKVKIKRRSHKN